MPKPIRTLATCLCAAISLSIFTAASTSSAATLVVDPKTGQWTMDVGSGLLTVGGPNSQAEAYWGATSLNRVETSATFSYTAIGTSSGNTSGTGDLIISARDVGILDLPAISITFNSGLAKGEDLSDVVITSTSNLPSNGTDIIGFPDLDTLWASPMAAYEPTNSSMDASPVPEPTSVALLLGAVSLLALRSQSRQ